METTIKFDLPEEHSELLCAVHGSELAGILWEITYNLRRKYLKHGELTPEQDDIAVKIFDDIAEIIDFNIDDLVQ